MATEWAIRQVNKYVRQGTLGNLPGSDILRFEIAYHSIEEQNMISERISNIEQKIFTEQNYLKKLQQIKSGLISDLLSVKKLVKVKADLKEKV